MDKDTVISAEALYCSMLKCRKGVLWKDSAASFYLNALERVLSLYRQLADGSYSPRDTVRFRITSPKPRDISSVAFRDRVYQRSLNDNAVYPAMSRSFIYDNFACQKGKGTDAARERLKHFLRRHCRQCGPDGWVAQIDVKGYYPNMPHGLTEALFRAKLDPDVFGLVLDILHRQYGGEKGYDPGSQLVQIAGISVLDGFDHYMKERLRVKHYIRYMDDIIMVGSDKNAMESCLHDAVLYLQGLGFEPNPKKTRVFPLRDGIDFLGFRFSLTQSGRVLMQIRPENVKRERLKLRRLVARSKRGLIPREKVDESYAAWKNHASKGNSFSLLRRMNEYYKSLWEG
jgi:hypothetical protein